MYEWDILTLSLRPHPVTAPHPVIARNEAIHQRPCVGDVFRCRSIARLGLSAPYHFTRLISL